jgi:hypothetical protein
MIRLFDHERDLLEENITPLPKTNDIRKRALKIPCLRTYARLKISMLSRRIPCLEQKPEMNKSQRKN